MRDCKACSHTLSQDITYKHVVVIGNGPSGILMSYILSGHIPYLTNITEDTPIDEMLKIRLKHLGNGQNLMETDLIQLAEGLEGRSQNPIPVLIDHLMKPGADLGYHLPPLIEWRQDIEKQLDHIVLGSGTPGGSWHTFDPNVRSLSPSSWLTLPPDFTMDPVGAEERVTADIVASYYRQYVINKGLQRYFRNGVVVTSVTLQPTCITQCSSSMCPLKARWCVSGYDTITKHSFSYICSKVVLGCGANDKPNTLGLNLKSSVNSITRLEQLLHTMEATYDKETPVLVIGSGLSAADAVLSCQRHNIKVLHVYRNTTDNIVNNLSSNVYPEYWEISKMMSSGDTNMHTNYTPLPDHSILEVITKHPALNKLPNASNELQPKLVKLVNKKTNKITEFKVSIIAVLIGSKPDLHFLPREFDLQYINANLKCDKCPNFKTESKNTLKNKWFSLKNVFNQRLQSYRLNYKDSNRNYCDIKQCSDKTKCNNLNSSFNSGLGYGINPERPVDSRKNPINIDKSTHELLNTPKGIYALGPLTSDNFVRFISGGAIAIASHIYSELK